MAAGFGADHRRDAVVHADPGRRHVRHRPAARLPAGRRRHGVLVHPDVDRRARRRQEREAGLASGLINTSQQIGGALGVAVASSVSISHFNAEIKDNVPFPEAFTSGAQWAFWVMAGVSVAALVATLTLIRRDELEPVGEGRDRSDRRAPRRVSCRGAPRGCAGGGACATAITTTAITGIEIATMGFLVARVQAFRDVVPRGPRGSRRSRRSRAARPSPADGAGGGRGGSATRARPRSAARGRR